MPNHRSWPGSDRGTRCAILPWFHRGLLGLLLVVGVGLGASYVSAFTPTAGSIIDGSGEDVIVRTVTTATDVYFVGVTTSSDLPVTDSSAYGGDSNNPVVGDIVVGRISASTKQVVWLTYLGGSGSDFGNGIDINNDGTLTIGGWTNSSDFPVTSDADQSTIGGLTDAVIAQFNAATGALTYASYLGGSGDDQFSDLAYVSAHSAWAFGGFSNSLDFPFPQTNGASVTTSKTVADTDGLFVGMSDDGNHTIELAGFHRRGSGDENIILGVGRDLGSDGFWITGTTTDQTFWDTGFSTTGSGGKEVFVNRIAYDSGARRFSKAVGGAGDDTPWDVAMVDFSNVVVVGQTTSADYPTTSGVLQTTFGGGTTDGFLHNFSVSSAVSDGTATYFGGNGDDAVRGLIKDDGLFGAFHFAGVTSSTDLPTASTSSSNYSEPGQPNNAGGSSDGFVGLIGTQLRIFDYHRFTYVGTPGEDGLTTVDLDRAAAPSTSFTPYLPFTAGTFNNPAESSPAALPAALPSQAGTQPTVSAITSPPTTSEEALVTVFFALGPPAQTDLRASPALIPDEFNSSIPYGTQFKVSFPISNDGPDAATSVQQIVDIPSSFDVIDAAYVGTISESVSIDETFPTVTTIYGLIDSLPPDSIEFLEVTIELVRPLPEGDTKLLFENSVSSATNESNIENNSSTEERDVRPGNSDISVELDFVGDNPVFFARITFFLVISNNGPDNTANVKVTADLGGGNNPDVEFVVVPDVVNILPVASQPGQYEITVPSLPANDSLIVSGNFRVNFTGSSPQSVRSNGSSNSDPNPENDEVIRPFEVSPDLAGTLSGTVFNDTNGNGVLDEGETPIEDMQVEAWDPTLQEQFVTTRSNSSGGFSFTLAPMTYRLTFFSNDDLSPTFNEPRLAVVEANAVTTLAPDGFVFVPDDESAIGGNVFIDTDNDGEMDDDEPGRSLEGIIIYIDADDDGIFDEGETNTTPDENGFFRFDGLVPDVYEVRIDLPALLSQTLPAPVDGDSQPSQSVQGEAGKQSSEVNFGVLAPTDLGITVDVAPTTIPRGGRANVSFTISNNGALAVPRVIASVGPTSGNDRYVFKGATSGLGYSFVADDSAFATIDIEELAPGAIQVFDTEIEGISEGTASFEGIVGSAFFDTDSTNNRDSASFTIGPPNGEISGEVFDDQNGNGVKDEGESGLGGQEVEVTDAEGNTQTVTTNPDGTYVVGGLPNGDATVTVTPNSGSTSTNGPTGPVTVTTGATSIGPSLGLVVLTSGQGGVVGVVFDDENGDGIRDAGESGISGVTVYLVPFDHSDPRVGTPRSTVTRNDGNYTFSNVTPGTHYVRLVPSTSQVQTTPRPNGQPTPADLPPAALALVAADAFASAESIGLADFNAANYGFSADWFHFSPPHPDYSLKSTPTHESVPFTYDGNQTRLQVTGSNNSGSAISFSARLVQANGGELPPGLSATTAAGIISPGATGMVSFDWDTDGLAWLGVNPAEDYLFRVEISIESTEFAQAIDMPIDVRPRPIVAAHGLWSSAATWNAYPGFIAGVRDDWEFYAVGDGQYEGLMDTGAFPLAIGTNRISDNARELGQYIEAMRNDRGAVHFDLVVHSMGGLISRRYVQNLMFDSPDENPLARNLVMLGTPNEGSTLADVVYPLLYIESAGNVSQFPHNIYELKPYWVTEIFNRRVTQRRNVPFSIAAGSAPLGGVFSTYVILDRPNDGIVAVDSALAVNTQTLSFTNSEVVASNHLNQTLDADLFATFVQPILSGVDLPQSSGEQPIITPQTAESETALEDDTQSLSLLATVDITASAAETVTVGVSDSRAIAFVLTDLPGVNHTLRDPTGAIVSTTPNITAGQWGGFFRNFILENPVVGDYELTLSNATILPVEMLVAVLEIGAAQTMTLSQDISSDNQTSVLRATFSPASPAPTSVLYTVLGREGIDPPFALLDTGVGDDAIAGDGIYTAKLAAVGAGLSEAKVDAELSGGAKRIEFLTIASLRDVTLTQQPLPNNRVRLIWSASAGEDAVVESDLGLDPAVWTALDVEAQESEGVFMLETDTVAEAETFRLRLGTVILDEVTLDQSQLGHSADTNRDSTIGLSELLRVIEIYNTRNGTSRTGRYQINESSEDGFAPHPEIVGGSPPSISQFHSADSNQDSELSLSELLRVIELYNTRDGTVRTGRYRFDSDSVDGFAPDITAP